MALVGFAIEHLSEDRLAQAWPVVRQSGAHANADWWISEGAALIQRGGGVLAVRSGNGNIHGIATYEVCKRALLGRVLTVDRLIAFELSRRAPIRQALCHSLDLLASAFDCRSVILPLPSKGHVRHRAKLLYGLPESCPDPAPD